jgi:drug/metabolite transporter (DMT)-like permease
METKTPDRTTLVAFILSILFAGNNAVAVKFTYGELAPFFGAALRFTAAALIFFIIMLVLRLPMPRGKSLQGALIYGVLSTGLNYALMYWALQYIQAGLSMVILAIVPLLTFLFAWALRQEAFRWNALFGALLAVVGIGIIGWDQVGANAPLLPILAVAAGAAMMALSTVLVKRYPSTHPVTTNAVALVTGSVLLVIFSALRGESFSLPTLPATWAALAYLVVLGTVATFGLALYVIKRWTASASSYLFVLMPIVTIIMGAWLTNERVTLPLLVGGAFVMSGAYFGGIANTDQLSRIFSWIHLRRKTLVSDCVAPDC